LVLVFPTDLFNPTSMVLLIVPSESQKLTTQTLASFGRHNECLGMTVDRAGNIYLAVCQGQKQVLLVMLEATSSTPVQLAVIQARFAEADNAPRAMAVTPDGQQLLIVQNDGKVLKYGAPFQNAQTQQIAELDIDVWCLEADAQG
jgi:hypothetical protein